MLQDWQGLEVCRAPAADGVSLRNGISPNPAPTLLSWPWLRVCPPMGQLAVGAGSSCEGAVKFF